MQALEKQCPNPGSNVATHMEAFEKQRAAVKVTENIYSVMTTNRNDRCLVSRDDSANWICLNETCKQRRAMQCNSGSVRHFRYVSLMA